MFLRIFCAIGLEPTMKKFVAATIRHMRVSFDDVDFPVGFPLTDSFGTFHNAPSNDRDGGVTNAVFVDGHIEAVHPEDSYRLARPKHY